MKIKTIIIMALLISTILISGCTNIQNKLDNACNYCGYNKSTDHNTDNNYNSPLNKIVLINIECDNNNYISLYTGFHTQDKWGNDIIKYEDTIFCK